MDANIDTGHHIGFGNNTINYSVH